MLRRFKKIQIGIKYIGNLGVAVIQGSEKLPCDQNVTGLTNT